MSKDTFIRHRIGLLLQMGVWLMLLLSPLTFLHREETFTLTHYLLVLVSPLMLMTAFYVNYFWLVPKYYFGTNRRVYRVANVIIVVGFGIFVHFWLGLVHGLYEPLRPHHHEIPLWESMLFAVRDVFNMAVAVAIATAIRLGERWHNTDEARLEAEAARAEAELRNLRSQINPHFLLNTLNNIYALTAIDSGRAQDAIQKLSQLLRHLLYDNQEQFVDLDREVEFLKSYTDLMRIRLPENVEVTFDYKPLGTPVRVAPLLAVSLVENAFKHGISPTLPSFIHIRITTDEKCVVCDIENSYYPKAENDRSGHGIGLQQVQRRLNLAYSGKYFWTHGVSDDGQSYRSTMTIYY